MRMWAKHFTVKGTAKRRRVLIENRTQYRTDDVRALIRRAAQEVFDPGQQMVIRATITYARTAGCTGYATIGGTHTLLRIPRKVEDMRAVGALIVHELGHLRGLTHEQMRGGAKWTWRGLKTKDDVSPWEQRMRMHTWAVDMPLRTKEPKVKVKPTPAARIERELARAAAAMKRWETKAKRAATAQKKLRARIRYYQKRQAAMKGGA